MSGGEYDGRLQSAGDTEGRNDAGVGGTVIGGGDAVGAGSGAFNSSRARYFGRLDGSTNSSVIWRESE